MRIWDVSPGYLSRQRLLGEHRELHGLYVILTESRDGYGRHPETRRWVGAVSGLVRRHAHLAAEMRLRGYVDRTPLTGGGRVVWPASFVTDPSAQLDLLGTKYGRRETGRIPLPRNAPQLWAHHKYSVLARDLDAYRRFGRAVSRMKRGQTTRELAHDLTLLLRTPPSRGGIVNAVEHMWGHVSSGASADERRASRTSLRTLLAATQVLALRTREPFLLSSTALGELGAFAE